MLVGVSRFAVILQPRAGPGERNLVVRFRRIEPRGEFQALVRVARAVLEILHLRQTGDGQRLAIVEFDGSVERLDRNAEFARTQKRSSEQRVRAGVDRIGCERLRRVLIRLLEFAQLDQRETQTQPSLLVVAVRFKQATINLLGLAEIRPPELFFGAFERFPARLGPRGLIQRQRDQQWNEQYNDQYSEN